MRQLSFGMTAQHRRHQNAKVVALDSRMSKAPKHPSGRGDLKSLDSEAGTPPPKASTRKPRPRSKRNSETDLDTLSPDIPSGAMEGSTKDAGARRRLGQDDALASAPVLIAEGNQIDEDLPGPSSKTRDHDKQPASTTPSADDPTQKTLNQGFAGDLSQPIEDTGIRADLKQSSTQHHPTMHELKSASPESGNNSSHHSLEGRVQRAISVWSPRIQAASARIRGASGRVKVWAQERSVRTAHESDGARGSASPIYILAALTLGIPGLLLIPLVGMNPGVQEGTFTTVVTFLVMSAFVTAVVFEIKRLADQPSSHD